VFRRIINLALWLALLPCAVAYTSAPATLAQNKPQPEKPAAKPAAKPSPEKPQNDKQQQPTGEQVAETVIYLNGTREGLTQVRRTGIERGRITRTNAEGKAEEATYDRRFMRGENMEKDRIRLEQKMPTSEYALIFSSGQTWGIINEVIYTPRQETTEDFLAQHWHGIDALLRYKENGSTLNYIGREKQMGVEMVILEVTDKEKRRTRYYISARTGRVLWLEYEETFGGSQVKYQRRFYDYRLAQGTFVPYRSVLYRDGKQVEETRINTVTYGAKVDETLFQNPDAPATTTTTSTSTNP
jgi:hypothetical protein